MPELDALKYLLSAYFHQDWHSEHATAGEVVDAFARSEGEDQCARVRIDITALQAEGMDDVELGQRLRKLGSAYDPTRDGVSWHDWLQDITRRLSPTSAL